MRKLILILIAIMLGTHAWADTSTPATTPAKTLKVGLYFEAPFVMKTKSGYGGYAIELWDQIAASQGWQSYYVVANTVPELIAMTREGKVDIAVTDMFITADRIKQVDFSHPYFDSGLQIMIDENRHPGMLDLLNGLASSGHLRIFAIGGILILVATLALTIIDRRYDPQFHREWFAGLSQSFYHVMQTTFTGKSTHRILIEGPLGYIAAAIWVAAGITIVAYITSSITSVMTANQIKSQINGPDDLAGKTVGTILGGAGESYCRNANLDTQVFNNIDDAVQALVQRQISAIVYDAPILRYYDNSHPELPITEVGPVFQQKKYGFALPIGSPLRLAVNEQLLALTENGAIARLNSKYFGDIPNVR
jgi:polar amino acid transport system substrate-binding protein